VRYSNGRIGSSTVKFDYIENDAHDKREDEHANDLRRGPRIFHATPHH
jgi:hypothetical protein